MNGNGHSCRPRIDGRYVLAAAAGTIALDGVRVFVTIDRSGAARTGALAAGPGGGALVSMPAQSAWAASSTPPGTPALAATVAGLLGGGPAMVLDADQLDQLRTSGCTRVPPGPRAVSWTFSKALEFEVVAFAAAVPSRTAATVVLADRAAPAVRVVQAISELPDAVLAVDGVDGVAALPMHAGGGVELGGELCISSNRSVEIYRDRIAVRGDGIEHASFGEVTVGDGAIDRAALIAAYRQALAANQLGPDDKTVVHVDATATAGELVSVIDAMLAAGETRFVLHTMPDLRAPQQVPTGTPRP